MSNRFGLEDINECANCGDETLNVTLCPSCQDARYDVRERAEEIAEEERYLASFPR